MRKFLFILSNIVSLILEYLVIFFIINLIKNNLLFSLLATLIIFILMLVISIFAYRQLKIHPEEDEKHPAKEELSKIINRVNEQYHKNFILYYVSFPQPNPAWCMGKYLYINNSYYIKEEYLPGVIAHELGHAVSGISNYTLLASLKPSTLISKVFYFTIVALVMKDNKKLDIVAKILFIPYYLLSLGNIIFVYPFLINDEYIANSFAVKVGYGDVLRCYYGLAYLEEENQLFRKADLMHPSIKSMEERLDKELKVNKENKDLFYYDNTLMISYRETLTIDLPDFIHNISSYAFNNPDLVKIKGDKVKKVDQNAFKKNRKLEVIELPNVKEFSPYAISNLPNLKDVRINDETILLDLLKTYQTDKRPFVKKILMRLVEKGNLAAIEIKNSLQND